MALFPRVHADVTGKGRGGDEVVAVVCRVPWGVAASESAARVPKGFVALRNFFFFHSMNGRLRGLRAQRCGDHDARTRSEEGPGGRGGNQTEVSTRQ